MTAFESIFSPFVVPSLDVAAWLARRVREQGDVIALRHKRGGDWWAWHWREVAQHVTELQERLAAHGVVSGARLVLSGAYEPRLLLTVLAAQQLGAEVVLLPRSAGVVEAQALHASHFWTNDRRQARQWLSVTGPSPTARLFAPLPAPEQVATVDARTVADLLWCEEGSEWPEGLVRLLTLWLGEGLGVAFPETGAAAARDRREVAPTHLLLSEPRIQALADEIETRLPAFGTLTRRWAEWSRVAGGGWRGGLGRRIRRLLGFGRLRRLERPAGEREEPSWLVSLERAA